MQEMKKSDFVSEVLGQILEWGWTMEASASVFVIALKAIDGIDESDWADEDPKKE